MQHIKFARQRESRRRILLSGLASVCGLLPNVSIAAAIKSDSTDMNLTHLINALRSIGKPVCSNAADRLAATDVNTGFDLHLRRAELNEADARLLAAGLQRSATGDGLGLASFSASFNPDLANNGTQALIEAFPDSITELGLVGCSIGDAGGRAILRWAETAPKLRLICVENNHFSDSMKVQLNDLANRGQKKLVVV